MTSIPIRRALISVYDKTGLEDLAAGLHAAGVEIVSTGSTAARISAAGVPVTPVEELTGFPECLDGRVKTLHPRVHAGLLANTASAEHQAQLARLGIEPFELLVSNLYPFTETVASGASPQECVEQIDIGGPAMVRAAAKNHGSVAVIVSPSRYVDVLAALAGGGFTLEQRQHLAAEAFAHTSRYDIAVASWFASAYAPDEIARDLGWPQVAGALWQRADVLRYGENPHQRAALYIKDLSSERSGVSRSGNGIASAELLHGKAMSYNNYVDADAARRAVYDFAEPCVAIIKHSNPCGIAVGPDLADAHAKANACDPVSAFGGVIAANGPVTAALARQIAEVFTEVVIAPDFDAEALDILTASKNVRLLRCLPGGDDPPQTPPAPGGTHPPRPPLGGTGPPRALESLGWKGIDVGSPFDHPRSGILYVARHLPPPGRDQLPEAYLTELEELIDAAGGRTLGLFSSMRAAREAAGVLRERIKQPLLCQGDDVTAQLVRQFAEDEPTCLFGTLSLWQGVDVPGNSLQLVVIDRIPFPRPDDPLASARQRAVAARGGNGFMTVAASQAALLLAQGAGRLLRTMTDRGVVAVLDPRLMTARYGDFLRASLPPFWPTADPALVRAALRRLAAAAAPESAAAS